MIIGQDYANALTDVPTQMLIAPVLPTMVSDRAYAVGEQFIVNSVLYKITQAVSAAGVALVVGTNCAVSDTITQQIKGLIKTKTFSMNLESPSYYVPCVNDLGNVLSRNNTILIGSWVNNNTLFPLFYTGNNKGWYIRFYRADTADGNRMKLFTDTDVTLSGQYAYIEL